MIQESQSNLIEIKSSSSLQILEFQPPIIQWYRKQLSTWVQNIQRFYKNQIDIWPLSDEYFNQIFLAKIQKKLGVRVVFDKTIVKAILLKLSEPDYIIFNIQPVLASKHNIDKMIRDQRQFNHEQKWKYILKIALILRQNTFISKFGFNQVIEQFSPSKTIQFKLKEFCNIIKNDEGQNKIKINVWDNVVGIDCKTFWTQFIVKCQKLVKNNQIVKQTYKLFQKYLMKKLGSKGINVIKICLGFAEYLQQTADLLCLFSYPKKVKEIQNQLQKLTSFIKNQFQKSCKNIQIYKFETYGSFKNKICLQNSDVDLTILVADSGNICFDREFICQSLRKITNILYKEAKLQKEQLKIQTIFSVINDKIKVPFARINFYNQMPLNHIDIVVNNIHGVKNSMLLAIYSENKFFRNCALLLKLWAKKNKLISPQKLSSYGLTLTLLYYLMWRRILIFPTQQQIQNLTVSNRTQQTQTILNTLLGYFNFYSKSGRFQEEGGVACIIKGCDRHSNIINQQFAINIHDPYDGSNPGRLKLRDQFQFYNLVQRAQQKLYLASKQSDIDSKKELNNLFGVQYLQV